MDFPSKPSSVVQLHPPITFPGWRVVQVGRSEYDVLIHLEGDQSLTEFTPDITLLKSLGGRGVILTRGVFKDGIDFESRFFAPNAGVPEDPATGSAHCTLAPYWAEFTGSGQTEWTGHQVSARGAMIKMTLRGDRVILSGNAITTIRGVLTT